MDKENKVGVNTSSGAEKVENVEKELAAERAKKVKKQPQKRAKKTAKSQETAAKKEKKAAKMRVEKAQEKKQKKELLLKQKQEKKRLAQAKKDEKQAKRAAARREKELRQKEQAEKRQALRLKRKEELQAKKQEKARRQAEVKEKRKAAREEKQTAKKARANKKKSSKKRQSRHEHRRAKGFGGWLAAVISLGVITLGLGSLVAVGAMDMMKDKRSAMFSCRGTIYELAGIMDEVDGDLDRARIASTPQSQSRILTDLLVQARLAESSLEKLPIEQNASGNLTAFINRIATMAEGMLAKLRAGERLDSRDEQIIESVYEINHAVRLSLDEMIAKMTDDDAFAFMKEMENSEIGKALRSIEERTMPDFSNLKNHRNSMDKKGKKEEKTEVMRERAEELCRVYFKGYDIATTEYLGETLSKKVQAYNFKLMDTNGRELFVQIDKRNGALVEFDFYENCQENNYDVDACETTAKAFLNAVGYDGMDCVYAKQSGACVDFVFVFEKDGVTYYPDEIKVKVCMQKGVVIGLDANKFLRNHHTRDAFHANVSLEKAEKSLHEGVEVLSKRRVVVATKRNECFAYEFYLGFNGQEYLVYVDAKSGEEINVVNVKDLIL